MTDHTTSAEPHEPPAVDPQERRELLQRCQAIITHSLRHERERGAQVVRAARALCLVHDEALYREDGDADFTTWVQRVHGLAARQARKYLHIGRALTLEIAEGLPLGIEALHRIARQPREHHRRLREAALRGGGVALRRQLQRLQAERGPAGGGARPGGTLRRSLAAARLALKLLMKEHAAASTAPDREELLLALDLEGANLRRLVRLLQGQPATSERRRPGRSAAEPLEAVEEDQAAAPAEEEHDGEADAAEADAGDAEGGALGEDAAALLAALAHARRSPRDVAAAELARAYAELKVAPQRPPLWVPPGVAPSVQQAQSIEQQLIQIRRGLHLADDDPLIDARYLPELPPPPPPQEPRPDGVPYQPQPVPDQRPLLTFPANWGQPDAYVPLRDTVAIAGGSQFPEQFGLLGLRRQSGEPIAVNLNDCLALLLVGSPGGGKSYLLSVIIENATQQIAGINRLPQPMAGLAITLQPAGAAQPELCTMALPNQHPGERDRLVRTIRAIPQGLRDVVILTEREHVEAMRKANPHAQVHGLYFATEELIGDGLRIAMRLRKDQEPHYAQVLQEAVKRVRDRGELVTWERLLDELPKMGVPIDRQQAVLRRLAPFQRFIDDAVPLRPWLKAGRLVLVYLHEDEQTYDQNMSLVALLLQTLVLGRPRTCDGQPAPKLMLTLDEGHKLADHPEVGRLMEQITRQRRHLDTNIVVASQDPERLPEGFLKNLDGIAVFPHNSAAWSKALGQVASPLKPLSAAAASRLREGQAALWFKRWHMVDPDAGSYDDGVIVVQVRPRVTQHGGRTAPAVKPQTAA